MQFLSNIQNKNCVLTVLNQGKFFQQSHVHGCVKNVDDCGDIQVFETPFGTVFGFFVVLPLKLRVRYHKMGAQQGIQDPEIRMGLRDFLTWSRCCETLLPGGPIIRFRTQGQRLSAFVDW